MKYNKEAVEAFIKNDLIALEQLKKDKDPVYLVLTYIQNGLFYDHSCALAGITDRTFHFWKTKKLRFFQALRIAESRAIARHNENITKKAVDDKGDWRASSWFLSKKDKRYREETKVEHEGEIDLLHIYKPEVENK